MSNHAVITYSNTYGSMFCVRFVVILMFMTADMGWLILLFIFYHDVMGMKHIFSIAIIFI